MADLLAGGRIELQGEHFFSVHPLQTTKTDVRPVESHGKRKRSLLVVTIAASLLLPTMAVASNFLSMFLEPPFGRDWDPSFEFGRRTRTATGRGRGGGGEAETVYIPGAGFSGFFYTLGRLQAFHNRNHRHHNRSPSGSSPFAPPPLSPRNASREYEYHCFSAGCLALVASLMDVPVDSAVELALSSRALLERGAIGRQDVVGRFVDGLLGDGLSSMKVSSTEGREFNSTQYGRRRDRDLRRGNDTDELIETVAVPSSFEERLNNLRSVLPRIHVITSAWNKHHILSESVRTPSDVRHLKRLLVQTTWIPLVTGTSFGTRDADTGVYHNDGAFAGLLRNILPPSATNNPVFRRRRYRHALLLPWDRDLLANGLNLFLTRERAVDFWREGLERGV